mgnify:CR=1 FL=1
MKYSFTVEVSVPDSKVPFISSHEIEGTEEYIWSWLRKKLPVKDSMIAQFKKELNLEFTEKSRRVRYSMKRLA